MRLYSGNYCMCGVGIPSNMHDEKGNPLFTGDIVLLWYGNYIGTPVEEWVPCGGLTAVTSNQYTTYSNGEIIENNPEDRKIFTMGIADIEISGGCWKVTLVKSHKDIVPGERFLDYGFNYK